jgi:hypothetical protein
MKNDSSDKRKSALVLAPKSTDSLTLWQAGPGLSARPSDRSGARTSARTESELDDDRLAALALGLPMNLRQVAQLIGCSAWSVRQRHIPNGLPHFRSRPSGKLIFYRDQVVAWILENQIKERRTWR